jgi:hypothetical protein
MRVAARTLGRAAMFAVAFSPLIWTAGSAVAADDSAAHALAEKFSRAEDAERAEAAKKAEAKKKAEAEKARAEAQRQAERRKATVDQRAKDEAEMQEAARQEAEARRAADQRAAEERTRIEAEQGAARADAARLAQEAEQRRIEDDRKAEEARQAEAARLAKDVEEKRLADERKAEATRQAEERKTEDARIAKEAEEKRLGEEHRAARLAKEAEDKRRAEAAKKAEEQRQADAAREALERQRTEEAERVAEKFRLAREAREARLAREREQAARENGADTGNSDTRNSLGGPGPDAAPPIAPRDATDTGPARFLPTRVTILLVMDPRKRAFATYPPTANPVLCIGQGCYVSGGASAPAEYMPRFSALGPANSIGRRAGPCRNQLTCAFRDVELGGGYGQIQPVDMGLLHHDRREIRGVRPDPTCDLISGRLFCAEPTVAKGYRAWIVPEVIATKAGAEALREALVLGLPTVRSADADPWHVRVHAESSR